MREFDYSNLPQSVLNSRVIALLANIHEYRARHDRYAQVRPDVLDAMTAVAKVQSTQASNRIEGIRTSDKRLREIVSAASDPATRAECEIAGYRDVLHLVHDQHDYIDVTPNVILQLHGMLYRHAPSSLGGHFKVGDNEIRGIASDGSSHVRFKPTPAVSTPMAMDQLCSQLAEALRREQSSAVQLLHSLLFVFDFTCVHPFNDGNGRMSRLLTLLLMYKAGYAVGKCVSIEKEIERTKDTYYDVLQCCSQGWMEECNDPAPFVEYMLGVILAAYRTLDSRLQLAADAKASKAQRVESFMCNSLGKVTKADVLEACPDVSRITVERALSDLVREGKVRKVGGGRSSGYVWACESL